MASFTSMVKRFFWKRCVDDVISAVSGNEVEHFLSHLNSIVLPIQFTLEREKDRNFSSLISMCAEQNRGIQKKTFICHWKSVAKTLLRSADFLPSSLDSRAEEKNMFLTS